MRLPWIFSQGLSMNMHNQPNETKTDNDREIYPLAVGLSSEILADGNDLRVRVTGNSMKPYLIDGDIATIRHIPVTALRIGDVILCNRNGETMTLHRLLRIQKKSTASVGGTVLYTKGDAVDSMDLPFTAIQCLGKAVYIERNRHRGMVSVDMLSWKSIMTSRFLAWFYRFRLRIVTAYLRREK